MRRRRGGGGGRPLSVPLGPPLISSWSPSFVPTPLLESPPPSSSSSSSSYTGDLVLSWFTVTHKGKLWTERILVIRGRAQRGRWRGGRRDFQGFLSHKIDIFEMYVEKMKEYYLLYLVTFDSEGIVLSQISKIPLSNKYIYMCIKEYIFLL